MSTRNQAAISGELIEKPEIADPYEIRDLTLPNGGQVQFYNGQDLTGADLRQLRAAIVLADGEGTVGNNMFDVALRLLIKTWSGVSAPARSGGQPVTWDARPNSASLDMIGARDLAALERHVDPVVKLLTRGEAADADPKSRRS